MAANIPAIFFLIVCPELKRGLLFIHFCVIVVVVVVACNTNSSSYHDRSVFLFLFSCY